MPSSEQGRSRSRAGRAIPTVVLLLALLAGAQSPQRAGGAPSGEEKQVSVYAPRVSFSLPVAERSGQDYVALLEALEPFGSVSAAVEGQRWKLRFGRLEAEFRQKAPAGKVAGRKLTLPAPFLLEGDRGLVPLRALPAILGLMLGTRTDYHEAARRLLLGGAGTRFTTEPRQNGLSLHFSAAVNPLISTEPGKLRMTFTHDPVISGSYTLKLENPLVSSVTFSENNGRAELLVLAREPVLAEFAPGGKTIDIVPAPAAAQTGPSSAPAGTPPSASPGTTPATPPATPSAPTAATAEVPLVAPAPPSLESLTAKPTFVVMLDAGHGGDDRGALLTETLEEKAVTLALARRLRGELQGRGINAVMSRDADVTVPVEQRAAMADAGRVALFVSLHAATEGRGVRVYSAMITSSTPTPGGFVPWDAAQAGHILSSRALADLVKAELARHEIPAAELSAPLKPLNNVAAAAIAIEILPSGNDAGSVSAGVYQQRVASAIAEAIAVGRPRVEAER